MKTPRLHFASLVLCALFFLGYVYFSTNTLPERVATHFDVNGVPDGWMSRNFLVRFMVLFGLGTAGLMGLLFQLIRFLPDALINMPNKDYWLSSENRAETHAHFRRLGCWFICLYLLFFTGVHALIVQANAQTHAILPMTAFSVLLVAFLGGTIGWAVFFLRPFWRTS